jgi:hypothetical protein
MRNRAKCRLCEDIIESMHRHDYVRCKCEEIAVDGGDSYFRCAANNWENFIRIDDDGNEVIPKIEDKAKIDDSNDIKEYITDELSKVRITTKSDLINELKRMLSSEQELPNIAMTTAITHYDLISLLMLLVAIFESDLKDES